MIVRMLKLITIAIRVVNWLTNGEYLIIVTIIIDIWQFIKESIPTPVNVELGAVSIGAPTATCSVQVVSCNENL